MGDFHHTAGLDTIFVQIYMDALPGVQGVSKNQILFFTDENIEFLPYDCPRMAQTSKNHHNWKFQKTPVFLDLFKYLSSWGQY